MTTDPRELAQEANLRYVTDSKPGFLRGKRGKDFVYYDLEGNLIKDEKVIERIDGLGIPPAWEGVWVCSLGNGHVQATGKDEKGRKQYIYHQKWNELSKETKFSKMLFFSSVLPDIRNRIGTDMRRGGLSQEKVLAIIVWLLDNTYIRIGNKEYAKENDHFGLTTLRNRHVDIHGSTVTFEFVGKSGKKHKVGITHPKVAKTIKKLEELPGYELFQYIDEKGEPRPVDSSDVNEYLKEITKEVISAKDFRTWGGTVTSATSLVDIGDFEDKFQLKVNLGQAVKITAAVLGNTTVVCRNYYIHPVVFKTYEDKALIPHFDTHRRSGKRVKGLDKDEYAAVSLLKKYS